MGYEFDNIRNMDSERTSLSTSSPTISRLRWLFSTFSSSGINGASLAVADQSHSQGWGWLNKPRVRSALRLTWIPGKRQGYIERQKLT